MVLRQCPTVTLADAGTDAGPLWLRISIAVVPPALAAIIAGYFALSNTVNGRTERLKVLVEIYKQYPNPLNPGYALERIMLRELKELDRATTPTLKWDRRFRIASVVIVFSWYGVVALHYLLRIGKPNVYGPITAVLGFLIGAMILIDTNFLSKRREQFQGRYATDEDALEIVAKEAQEPPTESKPQETPESGVNSDPEFDDENPPAGIA
jgi:hypothetical protein